MTKEDLLRAVLCRPVPFAFEGVTFHLLPLPWGDLKALQARHKSGDAAAGETFTCELIARAVCDEAGARLFESADVPRLPLPTINALFAEVAKRSGIGKDDTPGKA